MSAQYEAGICAGTFVDITKLGDELYWGGQELCSSAPADAIYLHSLRMVLRSTCNGFPCGIMTEQREFTSTDSPYNAVQTVNGFEGCVTGTTYDYDQIAYQTFRGTQYGPFVDGPVAAVDCNINPD